MDSETVPLQLPLGHGHPNARARDHHGHRAIWSGGPSYQAQSWNKPAQWFVKGLERFVNADDSLSDYLALGKAFPSFWPFPIEGGDNRDLSWAPDAHRFFLFYRNLLRRFWTRDPSVFKDGLATNLLFGIEGYGEMQKILAGEAVASWALENVLTPLRNSHSGLRIPGGLVPLAGFWPNWLSGTVEYISHTDFQRAVWLFFRESWRAKVCPKCCAYFLVQKSAQLYCSLSCSNAAHQASSLRWWKEKGSRRRVARTNASDQQRKRR